MGKRFSDKALADAIEALDVFKGMNVSPDLEQVRDHLKTWVECSKLRCLAERSPRVMYSFGATGTEGAKPGWLPPRRP